MIMSHTIEHLSDEYRLLIYIGEIAVESERLSREMDSLFIFEKQDNGEAFDRRKREWYRVMKESMADDAEFQDRLKSIYARVNAFSEMRDALVHGQPRVHRGEVVCNLNKSRKRYRAAYLAHISRTSTPENRKQRLETHKAFIRRDMGIYLTVSYPLQRVAEMAEEAHNLAFDVGELKSNAIFANRHNPQYIGPRPGS